MSKKSKEQITKARLKAGVKISSREAKNLIKEKGVRKSKAQKDGGMFPSLGDTLYG